MEYHQDAFRAAAKITAAVAEEAELELTEEAAEQTARFFNTLYHKLAETAREDELAKQQAPGSFEIYADEKGEYRFRLKACNGETIATSQGYTRKDSCMKGVRSVMSSVPDAKVTAF